MMKAFLKSIDGVFVLQPKVTTVGRDGCNLAIQSPSVASQHALIEYCDVRDWFVLQDLDTVLGTSVNGFLFKNTGVQLKPGDVLRFGSHPVLYEFFVDTNTKALSPTHGQFSVQTHPHVLRSDSNLPQIFRPNNNNTAIVNWPTVNSRHGSVALPRPPISLRPRPLSTLARRPSTEKLPQAVTLAAQGETMNELSYTSSSGCSSVSQHTQPEDNLHVQMRYLSDEVKRLSGFENACKQKDETIVQLKNEVGNLQRILRQRDVGLDAEPETRLRLMQMDVSATESLRRAKSAGSKQDSVGCDIRNGFEESSDVVSEPEQQLRKEKNLAIGLITQMQRDMANKDTMISRLAKEIEDLKKDVISKETNITALKTTLDGGEPENPAVENQVEKEQEIALLQYKLKSSESQKQAMNETISMLKKEVSQLKGSVESSQATINKYNLDLNAMKGRYEDLERAERLVRVALEQISKRLEKLRSRVIQTAYCAPGSKIPEKQISDDDLLLALKNCLEERMELAKKLKAYEDRQGQNRKLPTTTADNAKKLKQQMSEIVAPVVKKT